MDKKDDLKPTDTEEVLADLVLFKTKRYVQTHYDIIDTHITDSKGNVWTTEFRKLGNKLWRKHRVYVERLDGWHDIWTEGDTIVREFDRLKVTL